MPGLLANLTALLKEQSLHLPADQMSRDLAVPAAALHRVHEFVGCQAAACHRSGCSDEWAALLAAHIARYPPCSRAGCSLSPCRPPAVSRRGHLDIDTAHMRPGPPAVPPAWGCSALRQQAIVQHDRLPHLLADQPLNSHAFAAYWAAPDAGAADIGAVAAWACPVGWLRGGLQAGTWAQLRGSWSGPAVSSAVV